MAAVAAPLATWTSPTRKLEVEKRLQDALGIPSILACVLASRGFEDPEAAHKFLNPSLDDLGDPRLLPDFDSAVKEILGAKERGETIFIHGDYDVDGVTSAALLSRFLKLIGCTVITHVPHRMKEGYGIHLDAVERARGTGAKLFLTCDCGVSAFEQVEAAKAAGMRVVVTDHHTLSDKLPEAHAVINPHRTDSKYPFAELCGAGVAFRLCEGIATSLGMKKEQYWRAYLDLTVLGTVADVMPLIDENRAITRHGLKHLLESKKPGIRALLRESGVLEKCNGALTARDIGFMLGPRLNAAGRIEDAAKSLALLLSTDDVEASLLAREIEEINKRRKEEMQRIVDEAVERVKEQGLHECYTIMIGDPAWHPGIIGLVAGRLVEQFRRPAFVMTVDAKTGRAKGSARSIPGFNLADCIRAHPELVEGGGHAMAAGFSADANRIDEVSKAFNTYASQRLTEEDFKQVLATDAELRPEEISFASVQALSQLEPYGMANPEPTFSLRSVEFARVTPTKNPLHPRVHVRATDRGPLFQGFAFSLGERLQELGTGFKAHVLFKPRIDEYKGTKSLKWEIREFVPE